MLCKRVKNIDFKTFASKPYKRPVKRATEQSQNESSNPEQEKVEIPQEQPKTSTGNSSDPWSYLLKDTKGKRTHLRRNSFIRRTKIQITGRKIFSSWKESESKQAFLWRRNNRSTIRVRRGNPTNDGWR